MHQLTPHHFAEHLTRKVLEVSSVGKIWLLGIIRAEQQTNTIFCKPPAWGYDAHYFIMVLCSATNGITTKLMEEKIEEKFRNSVPVTAIAVQMEEFVGWLNEGHPFAVTVQKEVEVLYEAEDTVLPKPASVDENARQQSCFQWYNHGVNQVQEFVAGADLYRLRQQNKMAAFMLHQAAEHGLRTFLKIKTGYHVNTHNINRLVRLCSLVCNKLPAIFSTTNEKDARLFQQLQKAYIDARYNPAYNIHVDDLLALANKINAMKNLLSE